jgi:DivIVA domain-containing protein
MIWFFAILIVLVMGVVAVVASGRGGVMAKAYDDRPDARVQADGPLTPTDLRRVRFTTAFRGYRMSEVDALLDRLSAEMDPRGPAEVDPRHSAEIDSRGPAEVDPRDSAEVDPRGQES